MLKETHWKINILGLSETHLHKDIVDSKVIIDGYTFACKDRLNGPAGGVGCYINNI